MAGLKTGMALGIVLTVWLLGPGPMAPYRRALLNRSAPQLSWFWVGMWIENGWERDWRVSWICPYW